MASVIKDPGGGKRVQWCVGNGQRRTLRLGTVSVRQAEAVRVRIEQVLASRSTGVLDAEASRWLDSIDDAMHTKLARLGLVRPREHTNPSLGTLLDAFFETLSVKAGTRRTYLQTRDALESYFGSARQLSTVTPLECDRWRQGMRDRGLATATIAKRVKTARQIFKQGCRWKMLSDNPLADVKAGSCANRARMHFVTLDDARRVLDACPDVQWRLIVALSRFGGLRCPSEVMPLTWADIDFEHEVIHVRSCKTEAYQGKDRRVVPMFPELKAALQEVFDHAEPGNEHVIARHRLPSGNLRTQIHRIIQRAGLKAWPKPFHNMRSSRQTELAATFPVQTVCAWLGNSAAIAMNHYLQVLPEHFEAASRWTTPSSPAALAAHAPSSPPVATTTPALGPIPALAPPKSTQRATAHRGGTGESTLNAPASAAA